jgi:DNA-binding response OmpR family regulator
MARPAPVDGAGRLTNPLPCEVLVRMNEGTAPHILLVEDERTIREPLAQYLSRNHIRVSSADSAEAARQLLAAHAVDLILLDIMLPGEDGLSLCRSLRATAGIPIIMITARAEATERIVGLELGADDYVTKPFDARELLARIRAVLRRTRERAIHIDAPAAAAFAFGDWILRTGERELVDAEGTIIPLSTGEYSLLLAFVSHPRRVLNREQLLDLSRGREASPLDRSVDNQVSRLRRKLEDNPRDPQLIRTVWGGGYMFAADVRAL